jgi:surface-anchored protein
MFRFRSGTFAPVFAYIDGVVTEDPEAENATVFLAGHQEKWVYSQVTQSGVYCLPITWSTTTPAGQPTQTTTTLTYVFGNNLPGEEGYIDRSAVTPCAQGGVATEPAPEAGDGSGGDDGFEVSVPNHSRTDSGALIVNAGHVDVASQIEDGQLVTKIKDTSQSTLPQYHATNDVVLQLLPETETAVPASNLFSFLGTPGTPVWMVTQSQQDGLIWPGWSTEEIPTDATTTGITWTLTDNNSPGEFALYQTGNFGEPQLLFNTRDGISTADSFTIPKNTHAHGNWAFSTEGVYCLGFTRTTTLTNGTNTSDTFNLTFAVGNTNIKNTNPANCTNEQNQPGQDNQNNDGDSNQDDQPGSSDQPGSGDGGEDQPGSGDQEPGDGGGNQSGSDDEPGSDDQPGDGGGDQSGNGDQPGNEDQPGGGDQEPGDSTSPGAGDNDSGDKAGDGPGGDGGGDGPDGTGGSSEDTDGGTDLGDSSDGDGGGGTSSDGSDGTGDSPDDADDDTDDLGDSTSDSPDDAGNNTGSSDTDDDADNPGGDTADTPDDADDDPAPGDDGDDADDGPGDTSDKTDGDLPVTGANALPGTVAASLLMAIGLALVFCIRRWRPGRN